jgi:hypothetical protein
MTIVTSDAGVSPQTTRCPILRGVVLQALVPWSPVILVELVPIEPGGDSVARSRPGKTHWSWDAGARGPALAHIVAAPIVSSRARAPDVPSDTWFGEPRERPQPNRHRSDRARGFRRAACRSPSTVPAASHTSKPAVPSVSASSRLLQEVAGSPHRRTGTVACAGICRAAGCAVESRFSNRLCSDIRQILTMRSRVAHLDGWTLVDSFAQRTARSTVM